MTPYLLRTVVRQAATIRRQDAQIVRLSRGYRRATTAGDEAVAYLAAANDQCDQAIALAKEWKERAETLADLVPADVLAVLDQIGTL